MKYTSTTGGNPGGVRLQVVKPCLGFLWNYFPCRLLRKIEAKLPSSLRCAVPLCCSCTFTSCLFNLAF